MSLTPNTDRLSDWDNLPISHARIGYANKLASSNVTLAKLALTPNTYERWLPPGGAVTVKFQLAASSEIDYIALAAHNAGTHDDGVELSFSYATTVGGALTPLFTIKPTSNQAQMFLIEPVTVAEIAMSFTTVNGFEFGVLQAGKALQMYQPLYGGHSPINLSANTEFYDTDTDTGQFLDRTVVSLGSETSFSFRHLDPDWYRERFQPFVVSARTLPYFIKWRPDLYDTAAYGRTAADIRPQNMGGGHKLMSVTFSLKAHDDI